MFALECKWLSTVRLFLRLCANCDAGMLNGMKQSRSMEEIERGACINGFHMTSWCFIAAILEECKALTIDIDTANARLLAYHTYLMSIIKVAKRETTFGRKTWNQYH